MFSASIQFIRKELAEAVKDWQNEKTKTNASPPQATAATA
jgi:hypothetical protein